MSAYDQFKAWFITPLEELEQLSINETADGRLIALMISISLFERFVKSKLHSERRNGEKFFNQEAASILGIDEARFADFWTVYRVGFMHYSQPKTSTKDGLPLYWELSDTFAEVPEYYFDPKERIWFIRIDPWKWAKRTFRLWESRPDLVDQLKSFPMGTTRIVIGG